VHIDREKKRIRMYFHGPHSSGSQKTGCAFSSDGINFTCATKAVGTFYFRVFIHDGVYYAIAKNGNTGGVLLKSPDGIAPFSKVKNIIPDMRHAAVCFRGDILLMFYSRGGDAPERILVSTMPLRGDAATWTVSEPVDVLRPEMDYEGTAHAVSASKWGSATNVQQLRDPCIYEEGGDTFLYYSIEGEEGIAGAQLAIAMKAGSTRIEKYAAARHVSLGRVHTIYACDARGRRISRYNAHYRPVTLLPSAIIIGQDGSIESTGLLSGTARIR
jgi:hypothetical protein